MVTTETAARVQNLVKRYGDILALDNVNLEISSGEILGLLGPNGAGKTSLIYALSGLIGVDGGAIELFEKPLEGNIAGHKRRIGLVTQEVTVFDDLTARENLEFFGGGYGLRGAALHERGTETLRFVGLEERAGDRPAKYSGGMKRRLNIACALVHEPDLLIMDEPTVGIDPQSRNHILESVRELNRAGTTILYTTHYVEEVQSIADRVVILDHGQTIASGTVRELVDTIRHEEHIVIEPVEQTGELEKALLEVDGVKDVTATGASLLVTSTAGSGNLDRLLAVAREAGGVRSVHTEEPSLEDVFLTLTGRALRDGDAVEVQR